MTFALRRRCITATVAAGLCATSCGRIGFELIPADSQQAVSSDAGATSTGGAGLDGAAGASSGSGSSGGRSGSGGTPSNGGAGQGGNSSGGASGSAGTTDASAPDGAGGAQSGGAPGTGGAASGGVSNGGASSGGASNGGAANGGATGGVPGTGGSGPDAGPPPVCGSTTGTLRVWSFNSTVESWAFWPSAGTGTLTWTGAVGNPSAGALALDITSGSGLYGWIVMDGPAANLTGHTGSVWLWLDTVASSVGAKLYVQTNNQSYSWADGGFVSLTPRTWTCLSIDLSSPVYQDRQYDPANILRFGLELVGPGPLRIYADQFSY